MISYRPWDCRLNFDITNKSYKLIQQQLRKAEIKINWNEPKQIFLIKTKNKERIFDTMKYLFACSPINNNFFYLFVCLFDSLSFVLFSFQMTWVCLHMITMCILNSSFLISFFYLMIDIGFYSFDACLQRKMKNGYNILYWPPYNLFKSNYMLLHLIDIIECWLCDLANIHLFLYLPPTMTANTKLTSFMQKFVQLTRHWQCLVICRLFSNSIET